MTYEQITAGRPWVLAIDQDDDGPVVTLREPWAFKDDPGCGVRAFDSPREAWRNTRRADVYQMGVDD